MLKQLLLFALICLATVAPAAAQTDRFLALVVSGDGGTARADAVQDHLQTMGAETLRAVSPNNAQLRSILKRFGREAADARVSVVYLDVPVVNLNDRAFALPTGARVVRETDLFTQGIPIQAFARSAAQATQGSAVIATPAPVPEGVPATLPAVVAAPDPVPGAGPVILLSPSDFDTALATLAEAAPQETIELGALLRAIMAGTSATASTALTRPAFIRQPVTTVETKLINVEPDPGPTDTAESIDELSVLEKSLSRSAKRAVQRELRNLGHYRGLVDGIFGPQTRTAISAYQSARDDTPTGVLSRRQLIDLSS